MTPLSRGTVSSRVLETPVLQCSCANDVIFQVLPVVYSVACVSPSSTSVTQATQLRKFARKPSPCFSANQAAEIAVLCANGIAEMVRCSFEGWLNTHYTKLWWITTSQKHHSLPVTEDRNSRKLECAVVGNSVSAPPEPTQLRGNTSCSASW